MSVPAAPVVTGPASGGGVPVGTWYYFTAAVDVGGRLTSLSPVSAGVTTTAGNQSVTVTLPSVFPAGAKGLNVYRSQDTNPTDSYLVYAGPGCWFPQFSTPGAVYTDTYSFGCGNSPPHQNLALSAVVDQNGLSAGKLTIGAESLTAAPRSEQDVFLPGALTSTWTGATWTLDKAVTVTRVQVQAKTAPAGCTTNAVVRLTDGTTPVNVPLTAGSNDSGAIAQNYAAGAAITVSVQTAAAGCTTSPADANVVVQYRMQ